MNQCTLKHSAIVAVLLFSFSPLLLATPQEHQPVPGAKSTTARDLHSKLKSGADVLVIDVRTPEEYAQGHIPQAVNIPIDQLTKRLKELHVSKEEPIVTVCGSGGRSSRAALLLRQMGYQASSFCPLSSWTKQGYPISKSKSKQ